MENVYYVSLLVLLAHSKINAYRVSNLLKYYTELHVLILVLLGTIKVDRCVNNAWMDVWTAIHLNAFNALLVISA